MKDVVVVFQALIFCVLFVCSISTMSDIKNGVSSGKQFFFIFSSGTICLLSFYQFRKPKGTNAFKLTITDFFVLAYLTYIILKTWIAQPGFVSDMDLLQWVFMGVVYLTGKSKFETKNPLQANTILLVLLAFGLYQAIYGLQQLYGYEMSHHSSFKVTGSFFNPAPFAGYLISVFPVGLAVYHFMPDKGIGNKVIKYSGIVTVLTILLIIPSTLSRASWVALTAGATIIYINYYNVPQLINSYLKNKTSKIFAVGIIAVVLLSTGAGLFYWKKDSALGRVLIWEVTLDMVKEHPLIGVGFGQYSASFGQQQAEYFQSEAYTEGKAMVAGKGEYAFNEPLKIAAEHGLIGLLLFIGILFSTLKTGYKQERGTPMQLRQVLVTGVYGGIMSILVFSLFSYPFSITPILLNLLIFLSILSAYSDDQPLISIPVNRFLKLGVFILLIIFTGWTVNKTKNTYIAYKDWKTASQLKSYGDYEEAISMMSKIEPVLSHKGNFMFEYGQALALNKKYTKGIEVLERAAGQTSDPYLFNSLGNCYQGLKNYKKAEEAYIHAFYLIPHKFYPRYLLAKLYDEMGETEKAIEVANKLLNMKVKIPSTAIEEMKSEMVDLIKNTGG